MGKVILIIVIVLVIGLINNNRPENKLKDLLKCVYVAEVVQDYKAIKSVERRMQNFIYKNEDFIKSMDNFSLYVLGLQEQSEFSHLNYLRQTRLNSEHIRNIKIEYNSNTCQELYK